MPRYDGGAMAQALLLALSGPLAGNELPLFEQEFTLGRDESNSLCLEEPTVSRRHCVIRKEGNGFRLRDLGSANRTKVNGQAADEKEFGPRRRNRGREFPFGVSVERRRAGGG